MNRGEKDELMVQLKLIELKQNAFSLNQVGIIKSVKLHNEYLPLPIGFNINEIRHYSEDQLNTLAKKCGISKAGTGYKADTIINCEPISIKSNCYAPPALVNHTTRPGFEFAALHSGADIKSLDAIIDAYWELRNNKNIGEDISNAIAISPFRNNKEILRPFLNYFLFEGTGSGLSKLPANRILGFTNPLDITTWRFYNKEEAVDILWDNLVFSLRAKKGMPSGYPNNMSNKLKLVKASVDLWTNHIDGDHRGSLHIRSK